jgi:hypothetical protein
VCTQQEHGQPCPHSSFRADPQAIAERSVFFLVIVAWIRKECNACMLEVLADLQEQVRFGEADETK